MTRRLVIAALALLVCLGACERPATVRESSGPVFGTTERPQAAALPATHPASAPKGVPAEALRHRAELTRNARAAWGLAAPVATFAAQIHQESGWRASARSPVGAVGMAQFMPATADWIATAYPKDLGEAAPMNPSWAMRALVTYDRYLWERIEGTSACQRMAFALSAYNGGLGWVGRDKRLAESRGLDASRWWDQVEAVNAGRSEANWRENRGYPKRILHNLEPLYAAAGWGTGACRGN